MSLEETVDLAKALEELNVPLRKLVINGVVSEEAAKQCRFCRARRKAQLSVGKKFKTRLKEKPIQVFTAPQQPEEINGAAALLNHFVSFVPFGGSE
jgi:anion-transporting  ArsA/GET3 family ATPase